MPDNYHTGYPMNVSPLIEFADGNTDDQKVKKKP